MQQKYYSDIKFYDVLEVANIFRYYFGANNGNITIFGEESQRQTILEKLIVFFMAGLQKWITEIFRQHIPWFLQTECKIYLEAFINSTAKIIVYSMNVANFNIDKIIARRVDGIDNGEDVEKAFTKLLNET